MTQMKMKSEIDAALAQEKLDTVLEALHSAPINVVGLQSEIVVQIAERDVLCEILIRAGICSEADLLNSIAAEVTRRMEEMVDAGLLDEDALSFQTADEDEALGEV